MIQTQIPVPLSCLTQHDMATQRALSRRFSKDPFGLLLEWLLRIYLTNVILTAFARELALVLLVVRSLWPAQDKINLPRIPALLLLT